MTEAEQFAAIEEEAVLTHLNHTVLADHVSDVDFERRTVSIRDLTWTEVLALPTAPGVLTDPRLLAMLEQE